MTPQAGATPLYIACETGRAEVVKQLLEGGADQDAPKAVGGAGAGDVIVLTEWGHTALLPHSCA